MHRDVRYMECLLKQLLPANQLAIFASCAALFFFFFFLNTFQVQLTERITVVSCYDWEIMAVKKLKLNGF